MTKPSQVGSPSPRPRPYLQEQAEGHALDPVVVLGQHQRLGAWRVLHNMMGQTRSPGRPPVAGGGTHLMEPLTAQHR